MDELLNEGSIKHNIPPTLKDRHELSPLCNWDIHAYTIGIFFECITCRVKLNAKGFTKHKDMLQFIFIKIM
jgi:hypothetical protein